MALHCPATLFLAAHGEVGDDPPRASGGPEGRLTAGGRAAAQELARLLAGENVAAVYTSTARGAVETGRLAASLLGVDSETVEGLVAASAGAGAGQADEAVAGVGEVLLGVADRHRGEQVLVVTDAPTLAVAVPRLTGTATGGGGTPAGVPLRLEVGDDGWWLVRWPA